MDYSILWHRLALKPVQQLIVKFVRYPSFLQNPKIRSVQKDLFIPVKTRNIKHNRVRSKKFFVNNKVNMSSISWGVSKVTLRKVKKVSYSLRTSTYRIISKKLHLLYVMLSYKLEILTRRFWNFLSLYLFNYGNICGNIQWLTWYTHTQCQLSIKEKKQSWKPRKIFKLLKGDFI